MPPIPLPPLRVHHRDITSVGQPSAQSSFRGGQRRECPPVPVARHAATTRVRLDASSASAPRVGSGTQLVGVVGRRIARHLCETPLPPPPSPGTRCLLELFGECTDLYMCPVLLRALKPCSYYPQALVMWGASPKLVGGKGVAWESVPAEPRHMCVGAHKLRQCAQVGLDRRVSSTGATTWAGFDMRLAAEVLFSGHRSATADP